MTLTCHQVANLTQIAIFREHMTVTLLCVLLADERLIALLPHFSPENLNSSSSKTTGPPSQTCRGPSLCEGEGGKCSIQFQDKETELTTGEF